MACARSESIFCWPRGLLLVLFRELAYFTLPLWVADVVLDLEYLTVEGCAAECAFAGVDVLFLEAAALGGAVGLVEDV
jgi:hypothetical protein